MRVADLDRDMSAVFPLGLERDSEFLYARMAEVTYAALGVRPGDRVLDAAAGLGEDAQQLAERGLYVTNAEPSRRLTALAALIAERRGWKDWGAQVVRVRAWCETLPFQDGSFGASFCKGSLDHFDDPEAGIAELARVTKHDGRVVLAVVNMESLGCRWMALRERFGRRRRRDHPGRRHYDVPADHYTRYEAALLREQTERQLAIEECRGVSLLWGMPWWTLLLQWLRPSSARRLLRWADRVADRFPSLADVVVIAGRPRR